MLPVASVCLRLPSRRDRERGGDGDADRLRVRGRQNPARLRDGVAARARAGVAAAVACPIRLSRTPPHGRPRTGSRASRRRGRGRAGRARSPERPPAARGRSQRRSRSAAAQNRALLANQLQTLLVQGLDRDVSPFPELCGALQVPVRHGEDLGVQSQRLRLGEPFRLPLDNPGPGLRSGRFSPSDENGSCPTVPCFAIRAGERLCMRTHQGQRSPRLKVIASKGRMLTGSSSFALAISSHCTSWSSNASRVRSAGSTSHRCATPSRA